MGVKNVFDKDGNYKGFIYDEQETLDWVEKREKEREQEAAERFKRLEQDRLEPLDYSPSNNPPPVSGIPSEPSFLVTVIIGSLAALIAIPITWFNNASTAPCLWFGICVALIVHAIRIHKYEKEYKKDLLRYDKYLESMEIYNKQRRHIRYVEEPQPPYEPDNTDISLPVAAILYAWFFAGSSIGLLGDITIGIIVAICLVIVYCVQRILIKQKSHQLYEVSLSAYHKNLEKHKARWEKHDS